MNAPLLPPRRHAAMARQWRAHAKDAGLQLPVCCACGQVCYPLRELCPDCLSDRLEWRSVDNAATVLDVCSIVHSNAPYFRSRLPLRIGAVRLACGPVAIAFIGDELDAGQAARVVTRFDEGGDVILVAMDPAGA